MLSRVLSKVLSCVTLECHYLVSLSGVTVWCHSVEMDEWGGLDLSIALILFKRLRVTLVKFVTLIALMG